MMQVLADNGADLNAVDRWGRTPLIWAIESRQEATALLLLKLGAEVQTRARHNVTALHLAVYLECESVIHKLLERGADIDAEAQWSEADEDGDGGLAAIDIPDKSMTDFIRRWFLEQDSSVAVEVGARHGLTVRHLAGSKRNPEVQKLLEQL